MNDINQKHLERAVKKAKKHMASPNFGVGFDWDARLAEIR